MRAMRTLALLLLFGSVAHADAFADLKSLAGTWTFTEEGRHGEATFELVAKGNALVQNSGFFATFYPEDAGTVGLTLLPDAGNAQRFRCAGGAALECKLVDEPAARPGIPRFSAVRITRSSADELVERWTMDVKGRSLMMDVSFHRRSSIVSHPAPAPAPSEVDALLVHPLFGMPFLELEHYEGQLGSLGDALGTDCFPVRIVEESGRTWSRTYAHDGAKNDDWYRWNQPVLSPIGGSVVKVHVNDQVNAPGIMGSGSATFVEVRRDDDVHVMVAHLQDIRVKVGDKVSAGQPLGLVGNNGYSRHPHVHLGAWRDNSPLQLRFDQRAMAELVRRVQAPSH